MSIKQREDETLRSYIARFNKEALLINEANDKILVAAFTNGLRKGKFLFSLYKNYSKTMSDVHYWLAKRSLRRGKDRKNHNRIESKRWPG